MHWDSVRGCFKSGDLSDCIHKCLPVVRTGAPHQSAVDIEENQIRQSELIVTGASFIDP
jgi:hypothetical protein